MTTTQIQYSPFANRLIRTLVLTLLAFGLVACQTPDRLNDWPNDVPPRNIFIEGYKAKRNVDVVDPKVINTHLGWIIKFYRGTTLYPQGWNRVSSLFLSDLPANKNAKQMEVRLYELGIRIANEWSQDNDIRLINSRHMVVWGNGLRAAAARKEHVAYIDKIEADVEGLLNKEINSRDIRLERYFPTDLNNDDDNFDNF